MLFFFGLEFKPCDSRLEFLHRQKIKHKKANDKTTEKNTTKEEEKSTLPAAIASLERQKESWAHNPAAVPFLDNKRPVRW